MAGNLQLMGLDFGAHTVRRKGTHHLDDTLAALRDAKDCNELPSRFQHLGRSLEAIPVTARIGIDSMTLVLDYYVGLYYRNLSHTMGITCTTIHDLSQRNSNELRSEITVFKRHWRLGSTTLCTVRNNSVPETDAMSIHVYGVPKTCTG